MKNSTFDLIVIGGGAAGFFGAICAAEKKPGLKVLILEKLPSYYLRSEFLVVDDATLQTTVSRLRLYHDIIHEERRP